MQSLQQRTHFTFQQRKFDELEKTLAMVRDEIPRAGDGKTILPSFYEGITQIASLQPVERLDEITKQWEAHFEAWRQAYPQSAAPDLAYAKLLYARAWRARGDGYASTVFAHRFAEYRKWLEASRKHLIDFATIASGDPEYYVTLAKVEYQLNGDTAVMIDIAEQGFKKFPNYVVGLTTVGQFLAPKWGGTAEAYYQFADKAAVLGEKTDGTGLLARLYWATGGGPHRHADIQNNGPYWPKLKKALADELAHFPHSTSHYQFLFFACVAGDVEAATAQLAALKKIADGAQPYDQPVGVYCPKLAERVAATKQ